MYFFHEKQTNIFFVFSRYQESGTFLHDDFNVHSLILSIVVFELTVYSGNWAVDINYFGYCAELLTRV